MASVLQVFHEMSYGEVKEDFKLGKGWLVSKKIALFIHEDSEALKEGGNRPKIVNCFGDNVGVGSGSFVEFERAVASCLDVQDSWQKMGSEREVHLLKLVTLLEKNAALLAQVETINRGILLKDAMELDVPALISWFKYFASWVPVATLEFSDWKPYGFVAAFVNEKTPLIALAWLLAPALAAGNCICLCVPIRKSLTALLLADIFEKAGMPSGVFNVIPASQKTAESLFSSKNVQHIRVFGSTKFVKEIKMKAICEVQIKTSAVMTDRTPMLVFDSSDLDSAVESAVRSAWQNQGSLPWALKLLLVDESIFQLFVHKIKLRLKSLKIGNSYDKMADFGLPHNYSVVDDVAKITAFATTNGLEVYQTKLSENELALGFMPPTLLIGGEFITNQVIESQEYPPVISVVPFRTAKEAVTMANNSRYGMAASLWTNKNALAMDVADRLQYGTVWINCHGVVDPSVPLQGWKESGLGDFGGKTGYLDSLYQQQQTTILETSADETEIPDVKLKLSDVYKSEAYYKLYHSGGFKPSDGDGARSIVIRNEHLLTFAEANRKDVAMAVETAASAFATWSSNAASRAQLLKIVASKIDAHTKKITSTMSFSKKKKGTDAEFNDVVKFSSASFKYWGSVCDKSTQMRVHKPGFVVNATREPLGVVALGISCNLGLETSVCHTAFWQLAAALAFGNPVLVVVDMKNASGLLEMFKAICDSGIPPGVLSVLIGNSLTVMTALAEHQSVSAIYHWNYPIDLVKKIELAATQNMKVVRPCIIENILKPTTREFTEISVTRSKAIWIPKGEIFAN